MTNSEANNSSSATRVVAKINTWQWLTDRLPSKELGQFDSWMTAELVDLESSWEHMVSPDSRKRDLRQEFATDRR